MHIFWVNERTLTSGCSSGGVDYLQEMKERCGNLGFLPYRKSQDFPVMKETYCTALGLHSNVTSLWPFLVTLLKLLPTLSPLTQNTNLFAISFPCFSSKHLPSSGMRHASLTYAVYHPHSTRTKAGLCFLCFLLYHQQSWHRVGAQSIPQHNEFSRKETIVTNRLAIKMMTTN